MLEQIIKTAEYIKNKIKETPDFAVVLGSGLNKLVYEIKDPITIPYKKIPHFSNTTVEGHLGELVYGKIHNKKVLMMSGRFHYYEGYSMATIIFPIQVFKVLEIKTLILSNASGGVNLNFKIGDIMIIEDHINMMHENPLRGPNNNNLGPRFVDMHEAYDKKMIEIAENIAKKNNIIYHKGTYVALQGPTFETPAEYNMVKNIGGDAVGMSTIPEVIAARHMNMKVFALSVITDLGGIKTNNNLISHKEVLKVCNTMTPSVILIIKGLIKFF